MKEIKDFYNELGEEFLKSLLNSNVKVSEKLTGTKFGFRKEGNDLIFFGRDKRAPLNKIQRTITSLYEAPIAHIQSLDLTKIPDGVSFFFEYFYNNKPTNVSYDNIPKNGLILTHLIGLNDKDDNSIINDTKSLTKWSKLVKSDIPRVYFEGILSDEQKECILDFVKTDRSELMIKFNTDSFAKYIIKILNPRLRKTTLNSDIEKSIEGFIFEFDDNETVHTAKTIDPIFRQLSIHKEVNKSSNDEIGLLMYKFIEWLNETSAISSITPSGDSPDEKYIDLMSVLISKFISDNSVFIKDLDLKKPTFALLPEFKLNPKFIKNEKIQKFIKDNPNLGDIYKILISSFRKERKKTTSIIDENMKRYINNYVRLINAKTKQAITNESYYSFSDWKKFKK